jgi:hypothetical protein
MANSTEEGTSPRPPYIVSFREVDEKWIHVAEGIACTSMYIGPANDLEAPAFEIVRCGPDVGDRIAGTRTHESSCFTVVIEGTVQLDGRWLRVGDIEVAPAGVAHGDLVVGPDGATFAIMYARRSGMIPSFTDPGDQERFDRDLRSGAAMVASGEAEIPVALLPARDTFTPRRGAGITDPDEVARLMGV